jgi:hypothetical protein
VEIHAYGFNGVFFGDIRAAGMLNIARVFDEGFNDVVSRPFGQFG